MTYQLGPSTKIGTCEVAVISEVAIHQRSYAKGVYVQCHKSPRYVLVKDASSQQAFAITGEEVTPDDLEKKCPGLLQSFFQASNQV